MSSAGPGSGGAWRAGTARPPPPPRPERQQREPGALGRPAGPRAGVKGGAARPKGRAPGEARTHNLGIALPVLPYKYRALTDCATGACFPRLARARATESETRRILAPRGAGSRTPTSRGTRTLSPGAGSADTTGFGHGAAISPARMMQCSLCAAERPHFPGTRSEAERAAPRAPLPAARRAPESSRARPKTAFGARARGPGAGRGEAARGVTTALRARCGRRRRPPPARLLSGFAPQSASGTACLPLSLLPPGGLWL